MKHTKERVLAVLAKHVAQRSGIDCRNYGERDSFMTDYRRVLRDGRDARTLLRVVKLSGITAEELLSAFSAYSRRLSFNDETGELRYCVGQYFPTEYRAAACAVLAQALWHYWRANMTIPEIAGCPEYNSNVAQGIRSAGGYLRSKARRELGRGIANRWFN